MQTKRNKLNDLCVCGQPRWRHSKWASKIDRERVLMHHVHVEDFQEKSDQS